MAGSVLEDGTSAYRQVAVIPFWGSDRIVGDTDGAALQTRERSFSVGRVIGTEPMVEWRLSRPKRQATSQIDSRLNVAI